MERITCTAWGPPESLVLEEVATPEPGPGQVLVGVAAAGVNFVDALFVAGTYQIKVPPPFTPGSELAGTVLAVGEGVHGVAVGDRVLSSLGLGAFASHTVLPAGSVVPVPDELALPAAAALVQSYCTAWFSLTRRTTLGPGDQVLVLGAGGGVGQAAIDVARHLGARVIAAASTDEKLADAVAMGADATIAYEREDLKVRARELSGGGVDVVVDPVGGEHTDAALRALGLFGRLLVIGFAAGSIPSVPVNQVLLRNRSVLGVDWGAWAMGHGEDQRALLDEVLAAVASGSLRPSAPSERPLAHAGAVLRDLLERRLRGKTVLVPDRRS
ncbi:MAG: NADPH:quinone oxidoreductase family protein [Acidimicrobiales bacterium]